MKRIILMVLLGAGAVAGFAAGFARFCHGGYGRGDHGGRFDRHARFEAHVAETCTEAAKRVYDRQRGVGTTP